MRLSSEKRYLRRTLRSKSEKEDVEGRGGRERWGINLWPRPSRCSVPGGGV